MLPPPPIWTHLFRRLSMNSQTSKKNNPNCSHKTLNFSRSTHSEPDFDNNAQTHIHSTHSESKTHTIARQGSRASRLAPNQHLIAWWCSRVSRLAPNQNPIAWNTLRKSVSKLWRTWPPKPVESFIKICYVKCIFLAQISPPHFEHFFCITICLLESASR